MHRLNSFAVNRVEINAQSRKMPPCRIAADAESASAEGYHPIARVNPAAIPGGFLYKLPELPLTLREKTGILLI